MPVPYVRLLADRRIRGLAAGNLASSVGDGMAVVAVPWLALELAHAEGVSEGLWLSAAATLALAAAAPVVLALARARARRALAVR